MFLVEILYYTTIQQKRAKDPKNQRKMNTTNNVFDVSPFLLLEASADSEAGHDGFDDDDDKCVKDYDIDESSCSASSSETWTIHQRPSRLGFDLEVEDTVKEERDDEEDDDDGSEGEVNSYIRCGRSQHENLAVDSGAVLSEMDQSRMFWEACLAS